MKRTRPRVLLVFLLALCAGSLFAQQSAMKVAVVNMERAIFQTERAKEELKALEEYLTPIRDLIRDLTNERDQITRDLQLNSDTLSPLEVRNKSKEIEKINLDLDYQSQRFQKELTDRRDQIFETLLPTFRAVLEDIQSNEEYDLILNTDPQLFLYLNQRYEITNRVTENMNNKAAS